MILFHEYEIIFCGGMRKLVFFFLFFCFSKLGVKYCICSFLFLCSVLSDRKVSVVLGFGTTG